jgi:hypothetical protein
MGTNHRKIIFPFHSGTSTVSDGEELYVYREMVTMNIAVTGTATGFSLIVEAKDNDSDEYTSVSAVNLSSYAISPTITANGKYQLGLEGHVKIRCRLSNITSGVINVVGTVVD